MTDRKKVKRGVTIRARSGGGMVIDPAPPAKKRAVKTSASASAASPAPTES